jgi:hypothetical protein
MAFTPIKESKNELPWEQYPAATGTYAAGQIVRLDAGQIKALAAALSTTPQFICKSEAVITSPPTDINGGKVLVMPVETDPDEEYIVPTAAAASGAFGPGTLGSVSADGQKFVHGTAGKVLLLTQLPNAAPAGTPVRVKFVQ